VPPLLLGLPGDNIFSNYSEANRAFWRQTVLSLVARVRKSFRGITPSKERLGCHMWTYMDPARLQQL
jgi:phage portal protein BeeE